MDDNRLFHKERKKDFDINIANKDEIVNSIIVASISNNNESLNFHCKELSKIERNTEKHTLVLINILFNKFINYDSKIFLKPEKHQEILIIYIKRWFERYLYTQVNTNIANLQTYIQGLINLIITQGITKKVKNYIKDLLKEFIFYYYNHINSGKRKESIENSGFKQFFYNINKLIYEQVEKNLITRNIENIFDYFNIYESLIMRNNMLIYDNDVFDKFIVVIDLIMKNIKLFYIEGETPNENRDRNYDYCILRDISNILINLITDNISALKNANLTKELTFFNLFLDNERFISILRDFLNLNENFDIVIDADSIITLKESKSFLNKFKGYIFENMCKANEFIKQHYYYEKARNYKIMVQIIYAETVRALDKYISRSLIEEKAEMDWKYIEFNNYISKNIEFLRNCISFEPCETLVKDNKLEIFQLIILPLIRITNLEKNYFANDPENYISHILDFANQHQVEGPKSSALFLLEEMCKHVDGFLKFIIYLYVESMCYVISKSNPNITFDFTIINDSNYSKLTQYMKNLSDEEILEQSLQVLSMLSCHIFQRKDLIIYYTNALTKINSILIHINDEFLQSKLCLFYSYNLDDLFNDGVNVQSDNFFSSFEFLFKCFTSNNKCITINLQALDSINSLIFEKRLINLLRPYIKRKMSDIYRIITNYEITKTNMFLDLMKGLIKYYSKDLGEEIYIIFNYFWTNFKKELENKKDNKNPTIRTRRIFDWINNLKLIITSPHQAKTQIYQEVFPYLTDLVHKVYGFDYEEEIFYILKIINKDLKIIPEKFISRLDDLMISLEKNNFHIEKYHLEYIITFLNGINQNHLLEYKPKINIFIKKLMFLENRNISLMMSKQYIASSFLFIYIIVYRDYLQENEIIEILNILYAKVTSNHLIQADYIKRLCDCFIFLVFVCSIKGNIFDILKKDLKIFEILLVKCINHCEKYKSKIEHCTYIISISYIIRFMISDFNDNWSALLKSTISTGIDEIIFYKKLLSDEYMKLKDEKYENKDEDISIIGKKSNEKKNYYEEATNADVEIVNENNDPKQNRYKKRLNDDDDDNFESDEADDDEDDEMEESEEISDSMDENSYEKDKIISRDEVLKTIFDRKNKENQNDGSSFFVKKNINKIELNKVISEFHDLETFIHNTNEMDLFNETIMLIQQKYSKLYNNILQSFPPIKLTLFQKLLEIKKVIIDDHVYLRKIRKIKNK